MVSIIMPAYNSGRYIRYSIESVIAQTYEKWELIIIDDCSSDNTMEVAEEYAAKDDRIKIIRNESNLGVSKTRNKGVLEAQGEWLAFIDSDDLWHADKLLKQLQLAEENPVARLIFTGSAFIDEEGNVLDYILEAPKRIARKKLLKQNVISCSSVLVDRDLLIRYPMPEENLIHEDFAVWLKILEVESFAYGINEPLLVYRLSASSKSGNKVKAAIMNWNTYKRCGINTVSSVYYMLWYTYNGIRKYKRLRMKD